MNIGIPLRTVLAVGGVALLAGCAAREVRQEAPKTPVNYYVRVDRALPESFHISVVIDRVRADSVDFVFPTWIPGRYDGLPAASIEGFSARNGRGESLTVRQMTPRRWRLVTGGERYLTIGYRVRNAEVSGAPLALTTRVDRHTGYAVGAALFGYVEGHRNRPVTLSFELPQGWKVATTLAPGTRAQFEATSFAALPGTIFALGDRFLDYKLFDEGRPHRVVVQGAPRGFAPDSLLALIEESISHGTRFFGTPPYERYLFAITFVRPGTHGIGATGQAAASAFYLPIMDGKHMRSAGLGRMFLHQYVHAWYPGQFGPIAIRSPDFSQPPAVGEAWLIEGVAEYYARLLPARYQRGPTAFYDLVGELLTWWRELGGGSAIDVTALAEGSGPDAAARQIVGGALAAFVVDIAIRGDTRGIRGIDNLLYYLQQVGTGAGYAPETVWLDAARELGVPEAAFSPMLEGARLSIPAGLSRAGLRMTESPERRRTLGARLEVGPGRKFVVRDVERGGTAATAGLADGDRLLKINTTPIGPDETVATRFALTNYIREAGSGARVTFQIERDGEVAEKRGTVRETRVPRVTLEEIDQPSASALIVRRSLFRPPSPSPGR